MTDPSSPSDLDYLSTLPPTEVLERSKERLLEIFYASQDSAILCAKRIERIWNFIEALGNDIGDLSKDVQQWREDVQRVIGLEELARQLALSRKESLHEKYRQRIRASWGIAATDFLEARYLDPQRAFSQEILKVLANITPLISLEDARRRIIVNIQQRSRDTTKARVSKGPYMVLDDLKRLHEDVVAGKKAKATVDMFIHERISLEKGHQHNQRPTTPEHSDDSPSVSSIPSASPAEHGSTVASPEAGLHNRITVRRKRKKLDPTYPSVRKRKTASVSCNPAPLARSSVTADGERARVNV
ncbi:MAG: hypothetical protein Q9170_008108 [Blastenia crenularia]